MARYDPEWLRTYYNEYGELEWERWDASPTEEAKLHVHRHYVAKYVAGGDRVLEIGPGPGRFTQQLAEIEANVVIVDISPTQIELNERKGEALGFGKAVEERLLLDMCDLSPLSDETFDAVLCYGGPLSYVFERRDDALAEVRRVLKPGGHALFSVMSLWGAVHEFLPDVLQVAIEENVAITGTGDLHPETYGEATHRCHMFRAAELREALEAGGFALEAMSASNCVTAVYGDRLFIARRDEKRWAEVLRMEIEASAEPGCLDLGTHIIAVAKKVQ
jgi:SAM-dependent methyltransferase